MSVLRAVLDHEQPSEWTRMCQNCYSNSYLLFEVDKYSSEWDKVVARDSARHSVKSIKRVQNPFQLGLFKIQQEKRRSEYSSDSSVIGYHIIHPDDLNTALKYPLDYRRYGHRNSDLQSNEKQPKFFDSLYSAYVNRNESLCTDETIIIIQAAYFSPVKNQGDYYPSYVISMQV